MSLAYLPAELWFKICEELNYYDIKRYQRVSKQFSSLITRHAQREALFRADMDECKELPLAKVSPWCPVLDFPAPFQHLGILEKRSQWHPAFESLATTHDLNQHLVTKIVNRDRYYNHFVHGRNCRVYTLAKSVASELVTFPPVSTINLKFYPAELKFRPTKTRSMIYGEAYGVHCTTGVTVGDVITTLEDVMAKQTPKMRVHLKLTEYRFWKEVDSCGPPKPPTLSFRTSCAYTENNGKLFEEQTWI